jgi:hypothetical protein
VADWILGIPAIFAPGWTLALFGQEPTPETSWVAFASFLVVLLSLFYIPGAVDPYRYPASAWLAVAARPPGVFFFLWLYPGRYPAFGFLDLGLFLIQAPLLYLAMRAQPRPSPPVQLTPEPPTNQDFMEYSGSTFADVKSVVFADRYDELPHYRGAGLFTLLQLFNASARNLADRRDLRPRFEKLIHANGICLTGVWRIDKDSPYTGYFAKGSEGLVIARLSTAGPGVWRHQRRALGIAGKIFPTMDPTEKVKPANFVTVDRLSGRRLKHITDACPTNAPEVGLDPAANFINRVVFRLMDTRPGYRLLHPISTLGLQPGAKAVTPDLLMLKVAAGTPRVDAADFREELRLKHYPKHTLVYSVLVKSFDDTDWTQLGAIEFTEDVVSEGGDKRLHFWIPLDVPSHN